MYLNLFKTMYKLTEFYRNRPGFVEDMAEIFWCVFFGSQCSLKFYTAFRTILWRR